ncbi:MAG: hypothetical protein AB7U75_14335 [Hyphomicrobiaceae bacterium]
MGTAIAATSQNQLRTFSPAELLARLQGAVDASNTVNTQFMSLDGRVGRYTVSNGGNEPDVIPNGSKMLLNLFETKQGYACWKDNKVVDFVDVSLFDRLPEVDSLEDHGPYSTDPSKREGWTFQYTLFMKSAEDNRQYQLKLSAESAKREFGRLLGEIMEAAALHDLTAQTPVISLGVQSFTAKGYKNYKPLFEVVEWRDNPKAEEAAPAAEAETASEDDTAKAAIPASRKK